MDPKQHAVLYGDPSIDNILLQEPATYKEIRRFHRMWMKMKGKVTPLRNILALNRTLFR